MENYKKALEDLTPLRDSRYKDAERLYDTAKQQSMVKSR